MERHKRRWSVIYEGDVGSAWEWCQIKLHTSCDVPAPLNQLKTTVVDDARSIFAPSVVSSPDQQHFPKMLPRRSSNDVGRSPWTWNGPNEWSWSTHGTEGSRYTPSADMQRTTPSCTNDISIVLIWRSSFESLTRRRSGASQKALECYIRRRRR